MKSLSWLELNWTLRFARAGRVIALDQDPCGDPDNGSGANTNRIRRAENSTTRRGSGSGSALLGFLLTIFVLVLAVVRVGGGLGASRFLTLLQRERFFPVRDHQIALARRNPHRSVGVHHIEFRPGIRRRGDFDVSSNRRHFLRR